MAAYTKLSGPHISSNSPVSASHLLWSTEDYRAVHYHIQLCVWVPGSKTQVTRLVAANAFPIEPFSQSLKQILAL